MGQQGPMLLEMRVDPAPAIHRRIDQALEIIVGTVRAGDTDAAQFLRQTNLDTPGQFAVFGRLRKTGSQSRPTLRANIGQ